VMICGLEIDTQMIEGKAGRRPHEHRVPVGWHQRKLQGGGAVGGLQQSSCPAAMVINDADADNSASFGQRTNLRVCGQSAKSASRI
jgi:hypothetical protein